VLQHAVAQQCLSKAPPNSFSPSEKEKNLQYKGGSLQKICRVCKKLASKTKKQTAVASALLACALRGCHGKNMQSMVPTVSQVMTKNKTFQFGSI